MNNYFFKLSMDFSVLEQILSNGLLLNHIPFKLFLLSKNLQYFLLKMYLISTPIFLKIKRFFIVLFRNYVFVISYIDAHKRMHIHTKMDYFISSYQLLCYTPFINLEPYFLLKKISTLWLTLFLFTSKDFFTLFFSKIFSQFKVIKKL